MDPVTVPVLTVAPVDVSDLTTKTLAGTGVLDALLAVQRVHLDAQYNDGRIDNTQYAAVYTATFNQTLQTAVAFLLARDKEALELDGLDKQNRLLEAQISQANSQRLSIEAQTQLTKAQTASTTMDNAYKEAQTKLVTNQAVQVEIQTKALAFTNEQERLKVEQVALQNQALNNELLKFPVIMDTMREDLDRARLANLNLIEQTKQTAGQVAQIQYNLDFRLPKELVLLNKQIENQGVQNDIGRAQLTSLNFQNTDKNPAELAQLEAQTIQTTAQTALVTKQAVKIQYEIDFKDPQELALLEQQVANQTTQVALVGKQVEQITYEITNRLPAEVSNLVAQTSLTGKQVDKIDYEITNQMPKQLALLTAQVAVQEAEIPIKIQELAIAEKNVLNVQAQTALYAQKLETEKAQIDSSLVGANSKMDVETKLLQAQTDGFNQNALTSAVKLILDPTMTAISADIPDITLNATNKLNEATLGTAITAMFAGVGVPV